MKIYLAPWVHAVIWFSLQWLGALLLALLFILAEGYVDASTTVENRGLLSPIAVLVFCIAAMAILRRMGLCRRRDIIDLFDKHGARCTSMEHGYLVAELYGAIIIVRLDRPYRDYRPHRHLWRCYSPLGSYVEQRVGGCNPRYMCRLSSVLLCLPAKTDSVKTIQTIAVRVRARSSIADARNVPAPLFRVLEVYASISQRDTDIDLVVSRDWMGLRFRGGTWLGKKFCDQMQQIIEAASVVGREMGDQRRLLSYEKNEWLALVDEEVGCI